MVESDREEEDGREKTARWHLSIWAAFEARIMKRRLAASSSRSRTTDSEKGGKKGRDAHDREGRRAKASQPDGLMNGRIVS